MNAQEILEESLWIDMTEYIDLTRYEVKNGDDIKAELRFNEEN